MATAEQGMSMPDAALQILRMVGEVANRQARGVATAAEVARARGLTTDTLRMLTGFHDLARRFLPDEELTDLVKVERLCRSYELVLWETAPKFCRGQ